MLKNQPLPEKTVIKRRDFLSRTAKLGGMLVLCAPSVPVNAAGKTIDALLNPVHGQTPIRPNDVTVEDFSELVGQRFHLRSEEGMVAHAELIETHSPQIRRALRFRREHFSVVFDVPDGSELFQGRYNLSHPRIGTMELFMVPVDLPVKHRRLEAVFS